MEILHMDLANHISLLEYLAYDMDEGRHADVKLYAHILWLSGNYLEKTAEKLKACIESESEKLADKRSKNKQSL